MPSQVELTAWQTYILRSRPNVMSQVTPQLLPGQTQVDLLAALDSVQRCLIVGPSDSGKTTLLQWLISRKSQTSKTIVVDPHGWPDKWPNSTVVGTGRNYAEIERALDGLVSLMTRRYDEIGKGVVVEGTHPRVTVLIDEWRAIVYNVKGASEAIKALLTESRKAAFNVFVATHSDRAKPLGLEGEYDLKDGFAVVRLSNVNGQREATLDTGNGEMPAILPGPFVGSVPQVIDIDSLTFTEADFEPEPSVTEAYIMRLYNQGESYNEIARQVFGNTGGKQTKRIKEILQKFNRQ
jgi:energy-coupling factor transporter ATP-binding protein EcfA2